MKACLSSRSFRSGLALVGLLLWLSPALVSAMPLLYSIDRDSDLLRTVDTTSGATLTNLTLSLSGFNVIGGNGLAVDPLSGTMFGILRVRDGALVRPRVERHLVTINPLSGVATNIGTLTDNYAGLAFDSLGTLYGATGDGAAVPETLHTLDKTNAGSTVFLTLGNGDDGEVIAFNPDDGLMYHGSGIGFGGTVFESINLSSFTITDIPYIPSTSNEATGLTYEGPGTFLLAGLNNELFRVTTGGNLTLIGAMDHTSKGLAFANAVPEPATLALLGAGLASLGFSRRKKRA